MKTKAILFVIFLVGISVLSLQVIQRFYVNGEESSWLPRPKHSFLRRKIEQEQDNQTIVDYGMEPSTCDNILITNDGFRKYFCDNFCYETVRRELLGQPNLDNCVYKTKEEFGMRDVELYVAKRDYIRYNYLCKGPIYDRVINKRVCGIFNCKYQEVSHKCSRCFYAYQCYRVCNNYKMNQLTLSFNYTKTSSPVSFKTQIVNAGFVERCWNLDHEIIRYRKSDNYPICEYVPPGGNQCVVDSNSGL